MEIRDDYKFLRIEDAFKALHLHINLIGVIIELGFPTASGIVTFTIPSTQFFVCILLIDLILVQIVPVR